jgi:hypothetical protein
VPTAKFTVLHCLYNEASFGGPVTVTITLIQQRRDGTTHTMPSPTLMRFGENPIPERGIVEIYRLDMLDAATGAYTYVFDHEHPYKGDVEVRKTS